jgi:hypothetical protein
MDFGIQSAFWQIVGRLGLAVLVGSALGINRNLRRSRGDVCSAGHRAGRLFAW